MSKKRIDAPNSTPPVIDRPYSQSPIALLVIAESINHQHMVNKACKCSPQVLLDAEMAKLVQRVVGEGHSSSSAAAAPLTLELNPQLKDDEDAATSEGTLKWENDD